jgi:hydroxymethylglutaryl-CoA reductase (NADPH)
MPISKEQALEIVRRLSRGLPLEVLAQRLNARPVEKIPAAPAVPRDEEDANAGRDARLAFLKERGVETPYLTGQTAQPEPAFFKGNIENFVGLTQIPTGIIGPIRINGLHAHGDYYVPLATSEGALVASYARGAQLLTLAGGVSALVTAEQVQRAPGFVFESLADAARFAAWATGEFDAFRAVAATRTRHGELIDLQVHIETRSVYMILSFHTGDASGQNMVTMCADAICHDIVERAPVKPVQWFVESNMSGDKKATVLSFLNTRGRRTMAEATIPRALVEEVLHTSPTTICDYWQLSFIGGVQSGSIGVSGHIANGLAAIFLACGQDVACVSEASVGVSRMELTDAGDLYCGIDLPNLIVGTVGGGTRLPTAAECLKIMGCQGEGSAPRFAEIVAGVLLGGELSIVGALCQGRFAHAHQTLGRRSPSS